MRPHEGQPPPEADNFRLSLRCAARNKIETEQVSLLAFSEKRLAFQIGHGMELDVSIGFPYFDYFVGFVFAGGSSTVASSSGAELHRPCAGRLLRNILTRSATCMSPKPGPMLVTISPGGMRLPEKSVLTVSESKLVRVLINIFVLALRSDRDARRLRIPYLLETRERAARQGGSAPHARETF